MLQLSAQHTVEPLIMNNPSNGYLPLLTTPYNELCLLLP